ncbi:MAG: hypothetical protein QMD32_00780 [Smithellaceae bacterium]|nr:hypothetical protein [Smithellaceae bacterium]
MRKNKVKTSLLFSIMLLIICGCGGLWQQYGAFRPDDKVTDQFQRFQINQDYNYYITGSYQYPSAILGLDTRYALENDLWQKLEASPAVFKELISFMQTRASQLSKRQSLFGFAILDNTGRQIGDWYSLLSASTAVKINGNRAMILTPPLDTYERYEGEKPWR